MKVLILGSGGREHALAWKIASESRVSAVFAAPGSAGMEAVAASTGIAAGDVDALLNFVERESIDLTIVGPEGPLAAGIVDRFNEKGHRIFGPNAAGAQLEASKAFTKRVLVDAGVPTARYGEFSDIDAAVTFANELVDADGRVVVKADGLAAGKGVVLCDSAAEAEGAIRAMLADAQFGEAGSRVVVEEFLEGEEASFMALTDGRDIVALASSQDHKAAFNGDEGPNTGGMGAYSPAPVITADLHDRIMKTVIAPTVVQLNSMGIDFRGVLYAGLMIRDNEIKVLEYNVRFGDPECQPILMRLESSLLDLIDAVIDGRLRGVEPTWHEGAAACVVLSAAGYPGKVRSGDQIEGLEAAGRHDDLVVFHAGTKKDAQGNWITAGGRVLGVTGRGGSVKEAVATAYRGVADIRWDGMHHRTDIGYRAIRREQAELKS
jgi:phosphoribosylamine--glycine ligase